MVVRLILLSLLVTAGCSVDRSGLRMSPVATEDGGNGSMDATTSVDGGAPEMDGGRQVDAPERQDGGRRDSGVIVEPPDGSVTRRDTGVTYRVVETVNVAVTTFDEKVSSTTLRRGVAYRLRASGVAHTSSVRECDADYEIFSGAVDVPSVVDIGIGIDDDVRDATTTPDWGPYDPSHVYEIDFTGTGGPISIRYHDARYDNNEGSLTLEILEPR